MLYWGLDLGIDLLFPQKSYIFVPTKMYEFIQNHQLFFLFFFMRLDWLNINKSG